MKQSNAQSKITQLNLTIMILIERELTQKNPGAYKIEWIKYLSQQLLEWNK
jgi:DNA-dependent RNA polymerase auxiliary subunit epsilon